MSMANHPAVPTESNPFGYGRNSAFNSFVIALCYALSSEKKSVRIIGLGFVFRSSELIIDGLILVATSSSSKEIFTRMSECLHLCPLQPYKTKSGSPLFTSTSTGVFSQPRHSSDLTLSPMTKPSLSLILHDFSFRKLSKTHHAAFATCRVSTQI